MNVWVCMSVCVHACVYDTEAEEGLFWRGGGKLGVEQEWVMGLIMSQGGDVPA